MKKTLLALSKKDVTGFFVRRFSSFTYLNVTQFLGALNDNIYKLLIVFFFIQLEGIENSYKILCLSGAVFVLPFILFSASSGILADRFSKRNIIVLTKLFELFIMIGAIFAFAYESKIGSLFTLFLLATQSAIFGPSKYGIVPELVETEKISQANGMMTSFTFLAIIIGTFSASFLLDMSGRNFLFAAIFCTSLSVVGLITSFCIEYTPPVGVVKRFNILFLNEIYRTLKFTWSIPSLLAAVTGSAFFLFLGAFGQLNMIPYAVNTLHLTDIQGNYLFLIMAVGIGIGSLVAGKISGKSVELGMVPVAAVGITISCYMLDFYSDQLLVILPIILVLGVLGGLYVIPLDSYIQISSPVTHRGQVVAATNFLSFTGVFFASGLLFLITEVFGFDSNKAFTVLGTITLIISILVIFQFFDYLTRFVAMLLSKIHFRTTLYGIQNIPETPSIYFCTHTAWNDTLLILGAQNRRIRFFVEKEMEHSPWLKPFYKMLRIVNISPIEPLERNQRCLAQIKSTLKKGISVCVLVENQDICQEFDKFLNSYSFKEIGVPLIPISIEKGIKSRQAKFFKRLLNKVHVPASISFGALVCEHL